MQEEWFEEILANICELDDKEARLHSIGMNKFRSTIDEIKLAELIESLREDYWMDDEEIMKKAWLWESEIDELDTLTSLEHVVDSIPDDWIEVQEETSRLKLDFTEQELQDIHDYASVLWIDVKSLIMLAVEGSLQHLQSAKEEVVEVKGAVQGFDISGLDF